MSDYKSWEEARQPDKAAVVSKTSHPTFPAGLPGNAFPIRFADVSGPATPWGYNPAEINRSGAGTDCEEDIRRGRLTSHCLENPLVGMKFMGDCADVSHPTYSYVCGVAGGKHPNSDDDTGMFHVADGSNGFAANGVLVAKTTPSGFYFTSMGAFLNPVTTASYTLLDTDYTVDFDCSSSALTATLPAVTTGRLFIIKKVDASANGLTVLPNGTDKIDFFSAFALFYKDDFLSIEGDAVNGVWRIIGFSNRVLYQSTADKTVAYPTATETSLVGTGIGALTIPANLFVPGRTIEIVAMGALSTSGAVGRTLNIKTKFGSTVMGTTGTQIPTASLPQRMWIVRSRITCRTTGSSGTFDSQALFEHNGAAGAGGTPKWWEMGNNSTVTIDTTTSQAFDLTATWAASASGDLILCHNFTLKVL